MLIRDVLASKGSTVITIGPTASVLDDGRLVGLVSIGELVNASLPTLEAENRWLRDYVRGGI